MNIKLGFKIKWHNKEFCRKGNFSIIITNIYKYSQSIVLSLKILERQNNYNNNNSNNIPVSIEDIRILPANAEVISKVIPSICQSVGEIIQAGCVDPSDHVALQIMD